ncbi:MAG: RimK family alpha-L-glutamate ligase [Roseburia sp.]|nr:RimK family alpha-L-glutamate ligase [Roseburia sp.]
MKGWIVVNSFVNSTKFKELYEFFQKSAKNLNINLEVRTTDSLICSTDDLFSKFDLPNFIIFWDKDIYLAKRLENLGIPLFNSAEAIQLCDNKILTTLALNNKIAIPRTIIVPKTFEGVGYNNFKFLEDAIDILGFPIIIKEAYGSFRQQVYLAKTLAEAKKIFTNINFKDCLIQEFISSSYGRDVRINVVGSEVVASMLRFNNNDFRSNISNGGSMKQFTSTNAQKEIAIKACEILGLNFAGVDVLFGKNDKPYICEVNSNPHFKTTFDCTGIDMSEKILVHIKNSI